MLPSQPTRFADVTSAGPLSAYWTFYSEVASAQLAAWLPSAPSRVLDLSGERSRFAPRMAKARHEVIHVVEEGPAPEVRSVKGPGRVRAVAADSTRLSFLADACVDAVLAEGRALSFSIATEATVEDVARVLRPGGRMLLCVDSLVAGMARLAEQKCWAELSDAPSAEVLLVPSPDGTITRCFWPEQLREMLGDAGLEVEWVRPRTVLSPSMVERVLGDDPDALPALVDAELALARDHADESVGIHLVASARRPLVPTSRRSGEDED